MGFSKFSVGVVLLGILYSTSFCDTSDIFSVLKPNHSSSSSSSTSHHHKKVHEHPNSKIRNATTVPSDLQAKHKGAPKVTTKFPIIVSNSTWNSTSEGRGMMMTGSSGWGWPSSSSSMDLYSLLGGLAFLALIGFLLMSIFRSTASTTPTIIFAGKRRRRDASNFGIDEDVLGETFLEIMSKLGLSMDSPWWNSEPALDKKMVTISKSA